MSGEKIVRLTVLNNSQYDEMLKDNVDFVVSYAFADTQFGKCLIGFKENKICHFSFISTSEDSSFQLLKKEWPRASFENDPITAKMLIESVFSENISMEVLVRGTSFQEKVWRALLSIKKGETCFYGDVAAAIGCPSGVRAVANAIAKNPVSVLVPCHRVISKHGNIYKYGGGCEVKKKLLQHEGFHK